MKAKTTSLKESLTNEVVLPQSLPAGPGLETLPSQAQPAPDGLAELKQLEGQLAAEKPGRKETDGALGADAPAQVDGAAGPGKPKRKLKVRPENTFRMTLRQYWRLRDWMARRQLGLPAEYAGVFIQGKDSKLVEPLIDPVIGILETYFPDAIVFIEEKSPLLQFFIAVSEVEYEFQAGVNAVAAELKKKTAPESAAAEDTRQKFPSLRETTGGKV